MRLPLLLVPLIAVLTVNALYFPDELQGHDSAHETLQRKKINLLDTKGSKKPKLLKKAPLMIMKQGIQELNLKDEAEGQSERELQSPAPGPRSGSSECDYSSFGSSHTMNLAPNRQCGARIHRRGVSNSEIQTILQKHNELRAKVANGDETRGHPGPQPGATNMLEMKWNPQLAEVAQAWAEQCPKRRKPHDAYRNRKICGKDYSVGQNVITYYDYNPASFWEKAIESLYGEVKDMPNSFVDRYRKPPSRKVIGHYTQVVWADSYEVGCGAIYHEGTYNNRKYPEAKTYVCNYGPAGNVKYQKVYKRGNRAASNCPNGKSSKYNGLCAPPA